MFQEGATQISSHETGERLHASNAALLDRYRCPEEFFEVHLSGPLSMDAGFFRFGDATCYGRSASGYRESRPDRHLDNSLRHMTAHGAIPFDPTEVIENLRFERYASVEHQGSLRALERLAKRAYYFLRPMMPRGFRKHVQRAWSLGRRRAAFPRWPVDTTVEDLCERLLLLSMNKKGVDEVPFIWFWPKGAHACIAMTHDVETREGRNFCAQLMNLDDSFGIKSSFQIVPEGRYAVSAEFIQGIRDRGFEVGLQDLDHDGNLFRDRT